jgi:hypothetical protein
MMEEATALSDEIFDLQEVFMTALFGFRIQALSQDLLKSNESITIPPRKRRKIQVEDTVEDYAACLDEASQTIFSLEQLYVTLTIQVTAIR